MLTKCNNCGYNIKSYDKFCLNCGIAEPSSSVPKRNFNFVRILVITAVLAVFAFLVFIFLNPKEFGRFFLLSVIICQVGALFIEFIINESRRKNYEKTRLFYKNASLVGKEKIVLARLSELERRNRKIDAVLTKINRNDGPEIQKAAQKLLTAREIITGQFARYELQKHKIELVRLQNSVSPYLTDLYRLNEFETENGLAEIDLTKHEIEKIRQNLTRYDAIDFPLQTVPEKRAFLAQLDETEKSCQKLREALLSKQAVRALREVSKLDADLQLSASKDLVWESDVFNIQTTLTDFSESFDELEREYQRLKTEESLMADVS